MAERQRTGKSGRAGHPLRPRAQVAKQAVGHVAARAAAQVSPARRAAFQVLEQVAGGSAHSDDLLHGPALAGLSEPDRHLTTALVMGVLRWQIALEDRLLGLLARPDEPLPGAVQTALLLGAFQLLHLDRVPAHAALNESVELVRWASEPNSAGLVNAVLRRLSSTPAKPKPIVESLPAAATRLAHPVWLVERWARHYGRSAALAICAFDQKEPGRGELFAELAAEEASKSPMDDGSRLVAEVAAASQPAATSFWDCCAAPGGKTLVVAERHPRAAVLATDINPRRLRALAARLRDALPERELAAVVGDAADPAGPAAGRLFDLILCDVPCSGTGTLARNPEIRLRLEPGDLPRQAERQERLLRAALRHLAPGGRLLYSTCSLELEENEAVVNAVLGDPTVAARTQLLPVSATLQQLLDAGKLRPGTRLDTLLSGPYLRTVPGASFRGDGFFAALFGRQ